MRKFFESGWAFMVVAVICFAAGMISERGGTFVALGAFWLIMAIIARGKNVKKSPAGEGDERG